MHLVCLYATISFFWLPWCGSGREGQLTPMAPLDLPLFPFSSTANSYRLSEMLSVNIFFIKFLNEANPSICPSSMNCTIWYYFLPLFLVTRLTIPAKYGVPIIFAVYSSWHSAEYEMSAHNAYYFTIQRHLYGSIDNWGLLRFVLIISLAFVLGDR